jgi:hypothetical protein
VGAAVVTPLTSQTAIDLKSALELLAVSVTVSEPEPERLVT